MSRIKSKKYTGVYLNKLQNGDTSYSISYNNIDLQGKKRKVWFTVGKKTEGITEVYAFNKRNEFINTLRLGEEPPAILKKKKKNIVTLDSIAADNYILKAKYNRNNTVAKRKYDMHISPTLGTRDIKSITSDDIDKLQTQKAKIFSPKTVNSILGELGTVLNYAIDKKILAYNPLKNVKNLKVDNVSERYLAKDEVKLLLNTVKHDEQLLIFCLIALTTGARLGAISQLTPREINFTTKTINMLDEKNNERYTVFLSHEELENLLINRVKVCAIDTPLLKENNAIVYHQIKNKLSRILNQLFNQDIINSKHTVTIHTLRHTFASHLAINGTPIFTIQKLLNHKDINMTLRYAKLAPDSGRDHVEKLGF